MKYSNSVKKICLLAVTTAFIINMGCSNSESVEPSGNNGKGGQSDSTSSINWDKAANTSTNALIANFWNNSSNYWNTNNKQDNFAYWTGAHATDVVIAAYNRTGNPNYKGYIDDWYAGVQQQMNGTFVNDYYDDMEWNALALLRAYKVTNEQKFRQSLNNLWINIKGGWSDIAGGGIQWVKSNPNGKNAISNAPASILASKLYNLTDDDSYLNWAKKTYKWEKHTLVDTTNGEVWDNINPDRSPEIQKWVFTYNQGVYLGAALELYKITGKQQYLDDAIQSADYTLANLTNKVDNLLKDEGDGDGGLFKGIFIRYFTNLILEDDLENSKRQEYIHFLTHNAKILLNHGRSSNNLYGSYWNEKPDLTHAVDQSTQTSGSILIESMARLQNNDMLND